jgi:hypothetical protein
MGDIFNPIEFTIPSGTKGDAVNPVSLGRHAENGVLITCDDAAGIANGSSMNLQIAIPPDNDRTMLDLYDQDDPGTLWAGASIPDTGTMACHVPSARNAFWVRIILSINTTADVTFKVYPLG